MIETRVVVSRSLIYLLFEETTAKISLAILYFYLSFCDSWKRTQKKSFPELFRRTYIIFVIFVIVRCINNNRHCPKNLFEKLLVDKVLK